MHYRFDAIAKLMQLKISEFSSLANLVCLRAGLMPEDETIVHMIASLIIPGYSRNAHCDADNLYPMFLEKPNWQSGFFDAYHPKSSNLAGRFRAGTKPQYFLNNDELFASHFELPTDKIGYFDCIEFGRKAEYPFPEIKNDYDLNIQSQRDKSKIPLVEKAMQIAIKASI